MTAPQPAPPPRVLVATASVGAGHNSAAQAICAALEGCGDNMDVKYFDVLTETAWIYRAYYAGGYAMAVSALAPFYGIGYKLTDRPHGPRRAFNERFRLWHERHWMRRFAQYLIDYQPDIVVNTHFLAPPLIGWMKQRRLIDCDQMVVITDNEAHRYWMAENVSHWFAPAPHCVEPLIKWGVNRQDITMSGIPVHPKWLAPVDDARVRADWNLPPHAPIVLLSGGTEFTCAPVAKIAAMIAQRCPQACVVVLAGNNRNLLTKLTRLAARVKQIVPVAFTDRACELVHISSIMVTKAGGITTAECLAKGTPMVILKPVPGQEAANAQYFADNGAAVIPGKPAQVADCVKSLLADPEKLTRLSAAAKALYNPATQTIASAIRQSLHQSAE